MKKMLLSAALIMAAFSANAQEIGYLDPAVTGATEDGITIAAGTTLATTEHVTVTNRYDDTFKATGLKGNNMTFNGEALATSDMGIQGNTNGPGTAASAGEWPTQGCIYTFTPSADGYIYVFHAGSGNKNYVVFENRTRIPYIYAMVNTGGNSYNDGTAPATFAYDLMNIDGATYYDEIIDGYYVDPGFAILQAGQVSEGNDASYTYNATTGNSVIKFQVFAGCYYDVLATGSKMTLVAFAYDTTGDATVTAGATSDSDAPADVVLLQNGQIPGGDTGITGVTVAEEADVNAPAYNIAGQRVSKSAKGLVIINGKKYLNK